MSRKLMFCPKCNLAGEAMEGCIEKQGLGCPTPVQAIPGKHIQVSYTAPNGDEREKVFTAEQVVNDPQATNPKFLPIPALKPPSK